MLSPLYELLIFDLDGTLIDSERDLTASVNFVRAGFKKPSLDVPTIRGYIGSGVVTLMERALPDVTPDELEKAVNDFRNYYRAHLLDTTRLYPGITAVLERYAGIKKAVLTNKPEDLSLKILSGLGISDCFVKVWGGDTGRRKKPDPEPVRNVISLLNAQKERTVMIGDGPNDILAANNAGIKCVAVTYGYSTRGELERYSPDYFVDSPDELSKIIS